MSNDTSSRYYNHWLDQLTQDIIDNWPGVTHFNCNCGLSVSGLQHIGRLRGEIILTNAVTKSLIENGYHATHTLILYTSDPWKGKDSQINAFDNPEEARKYVNWRLIDVPSPKSDSANWVDYCWKDFGESMPQFATDVNIVYTHEFYKRQETKEFIKKIIEYREEVRTILNKYRADNPFPEDWIPINPLCSKCGRIGTTKTIDIDIESYKVKYHCEGCHSEGWSDIADGKLTWRLEWLAIWYLLDVHFEPYGKDHATPGGSRDSCIEIVEKVFKHKAPFGFWNEWVGYSEGRKDYGDMTSSGFVGFSPKKWLEYADAKVLKYMYLKTPPKRRIVIGLDKIPSYVNDFDRAERIYHGLETLNNESELKVLKRSWEICYDGRVPPYRGFQFEFLQAIIISQLVELDKEGVKKAIAKIQGSLDVDEKLLLDNYDYINDRLIKARRWVDDWAPPHLRITIPEKIDRTFFENIDKEIITVIKDMRNRLTQAKWTEENIKNIMISVRDEYNLSKKQMKQFFQSLYHLFLDKNMGPRFAPFIANLDKKWVLERFCFIDDF